MSWREPCGVVDRGREDEPGAYLQTSHKADLSELRPLGNVSLHLCSAYLAYSAQLGVERRLIDLIGFVVRRWPQVGRSTTKNTPVPSPILQTLLSSRAEYCMHNHLQPLLYLPSNTFISVEPQSEAAPNEVRTSCPAGKQHVRLSSQVIPLPEHPSTANLTGYGRWRTS